MKTKSLKAMIAAQKLRAIPFGLNGYEIDVKPLSINQAYTYISRRGGRGGDRIKTRGYKEYELILLTVLSNVMRVVPEGKLSIKYEFGVSNAASDIDNLIKPLQDILQKAYGFNDNRVYHIDIIKKVVKKGEEYVKFKIDQFEE
jgi:Holliday junction resolvase RusA-like endonuclease